MSNNVEITAGSGTPVATDDVSGTHYQVVKLADGTEDSSTRILAGGGVEAGALRVTIASDSTGVLSIDDNGASLTVDGTVAATQSGTWTVDLGATDNAVLDAIAASLAGTLTVGSHAVTNAGTFAVQVDGAALTALQVIDDWDESDRAKVNLIVGQAGIAAGAGSVGVTVPRVTLASDDPAVALLGTIDTDTSNAATSLGIMDDWDNAASDGCSVSGDVAHDDADAGEPVKIGAKAIAHGTNPTAVAANDRTNLYANRAGVLFTIGGHPNMVTIRANYTAAQTDTAIVTISTGSKIVVTRVTVTADNANTVDVAVRIGFGTANTPTTTGVVAAHPGVPPGGGFTIGDGSGMLAIGADNEDLRITSEVPTTGSIDVVVSYYTVDS